MTHKNLIEIFGSCGLSFHHGKSQSVTFCFCIIGIFGVENPWEVLCEQVLRCVVSFFIGKESYTGALWGRYPQHTENFTSHAWLAGRAMSQHEDRRGQRREPNVVNTARTQVSAGRKCGLSGCICGFKPQNEHRNLILVLFMGLSI